MPTPMDPTDYRSRVYECYLRTHQTEVAGDGAGALASRGPYLTRLIRRHFPQDRAATVLDLGCGHGTLLHFARREGYRNVLGVDRSLEQIATAKRLGIDGVQQGDLLDTLQSLADRSQDVVVTFDVIEHLRREELLPLADEVLRVLRSGGRWLIHTPNAESPFFGRIRYGDLTHEQAFTRASIGQVLLACGFRSFECFEDVPVVHGAKSALRVVAWAIIRAGLRAYLAAETGNTGRDAILTQNFLTVATK